MGDTLRKQRLEEGIFTTDLNRQHIGPIEVEEIKVPPSVEELKDRVEKLDTRLGMVEQAVASIDTVLVGRDGKGGAIERLDRGQAEMRAILEQTTKEITDAVKGMSNLHHNDVSELDTKIRDSYELAKDANGTATENKTKLDSHLEAHQTETDSNRKAWIARAWSLLKTVITVVLTALGMRWLS